MVSPQISKEDCSWVLGVKLVLRVVLTTTIVFPLENPDEAPAFLFLPLSFLLSPFLFLPSSFYLLPFRDISCSPNWLEFTIPPCYLYLMLTLTSGSSCPHLQSARITAVHTNIQLLVHAFLESSVLCVNVEHLWHWPVTLLVSDPSILPSILLGLSS